jgi:RNA polymerase sigma-70 factor (ECF subfamily)
VSAIKPTERGSCDCQVGTLGHLLYADKGRSPVSEQEWVGLLRAIAAGNITNERATAEELTVDVFHDVWRRACKYDAAGGTVLGWNMNQARCRAIDRLRFERRKKRVNGHPNEHLPASVAPGAEETLDRSQLRRALRNALTVRTPDERCAIESAFFSELSYAEVAGG